MAKEFSLNHIPQNAYSANTFCLFYPIVSLFTFTTSMLFAFPAFRNMMPLAPPIGAFPDYIAFFWAEGIAAITLVVLISSWFFRKQN